MNVIPLSSTGSSVTVEFLSGKICLLATLPGDFFYNYDNKII